ncbi:MAG: 50S ribosomal protein L4 [Clostridia bacterium]|nr:50S ribosomal protein L4 [Clostridia bacterium]MBQ8268479.1 50S ribosomal protein L4 [Clostridia bacterium]MBR2324820.1 50S ribosomal protein L4 [Clostridia bacterium]
MPNMKVVDMAGKEVGEITLSDLVFGAEVNEAVLHTAVRAFLLNQRQGTQSTLTRSEVSGGGKKPWKQKGTGRARQGSTRSPQWTHGGVALGPKPRSYRVTMNKRVKRVALFSALSAKVNAGEMIVVDSITMNEYKTKTVVGMLNALGAQKKALIVLPEVNEFVIKSAANIEGVKTTQWNTINVYDILNCDTFIVAKDAVNKIEEVYAR